MLLLMYAIMTWHMGSVSIWMYGLVDQVHTHNGKPCNITVKYY